MSSTLPIFELTLEVKICPTSIKGISQNRLTFESFTEGELNPAAKTIIPVIIDTGAPTTIIFCNNYQAAEGLKRYINGELLGQFYITPLGYSHRRVSWIESEDKKCYLNIHRPQILNLENHPEVKESITACFFEKKFFMLLGLDSLLKNKFCLNLHNRKALIY